MVPTTPTPCVVRNELAAKIVKTIKETYDAKQNDLRKVEALKHDPTQLILCVAKAREAEREAVAALDKHRKEHSC